MKSRYVMTARAAAAQATADRIIEAALKRFSSAAYDEVRLEDIAADAGVTVQTVLRRFNSKEGLARACQQAYEERAVEAARDRAVPGSVDEIAASVVQQYEDTGDLLLHLLRQEAAVPVFAELLTLGRKAHLHWCSEMFAQFLEGRSRLERERLLAQVVAVCDVYTWFLLRRQQGLSRRQTVLAITELLNGLLS